MANELFYLSKKDMSISDAFLNKGFLWGEAPFTTIYMHKGDIVFKDLHFRRIEKTLAYLGEENIAPRLKEIDSVLHNFSKTFEAIESVYLRITFFCELDGTVQYFVWAVNRSQGTSPLRLKTVESFPSGDYPYFLKSGDYSFKFSKRDEARSLGFDDVLFYNEKGEVLDTSVANIFYVKDSSLYFSELIPGILDGVCRAEIISYCSQIELKIYEKKFTLNELKIADYVFVTNAFSGVRAISQIDEKEFSIDEAEKFRSMFSTWMGGVWPKN